MAKKKIKKLFKNIKEENDFIWSLLIKARADFSSEINGETDCNLQSHHLAGKSCLSLRYSTLNGYCCSEGQHKFGFHHTGRSESYRKIVQAQRCENIFDKLSVVARMPSKPIRQYNLILLVQLKEYEEPLKQFYQARNYKTKSVRDKYEYVIEQLERLK